MELSDKMGFENDLKSSALKNLILVYLGYWQLFLICLAVFIGLGLLYIRYTEPKYLATTSLLSLAEEGQSAKSDDIIETAFNGSKEVNLNNQLLVLRSNDLMQRTVAKNGFNISYRQGGLVLNLDIYDQAPFILSIDSSIIDSSKSYDIKITNVHSGGAFVEYDSSKNKKQAQVFWNKPFNVNGQVFTISRRDVKTNFDSEAEYLVKYSPVEITSANLIKNLTVKPFDAKTSAIQLTLETENLKKGTDVLNALFEEFNFLDISERLKLSENTVRFIDDRLAVISNTLRSVETDIVSFQGKNQLVDVKDQMSQTLQNTDYISKAIKDIGIQQGLVATIQDYLQSPKNQNKLVPSALGLNDPTLASLIVRYNEVQLKKEREAPLVAQGSTVMQDLNNQLSSLKNSIQESLNNFLSSLKVQEQNLKTQKSQYGNFLAALPHNERTLQEIRRKQSISEGLYLYLLQKREQAAISSTAANVSRFRQIDKASGYGPVEPSTANVLIYTTLLALFCAVIIIFVMRFFNQRLSSSEEIATLSALPIVGEISHIPRRKKKAIDVLDRDVTSEEFRALRTSVSLILRDKNRKFVMVTSSVPGEGKSFISFNLAAVFALTGKKVAFVELDLRKPVLRHRLDVESEFGVADYLSEKISRLNNIYVEVDNFPCLHVYPAGSPSSNPADLLLTKNLQNFISDLQLQYDYVFFDTPPTSLVSDSLILQQYVDLIVYVVREHVTGKKSIKAIEKILDPENKCDVYIVANDIKAKSIYQEYYQFGNGKPHYEVNVIGDNKIQDVKR